MKIFKSKSQSPAASIKYQFLTQIAFILKYHSYKCLKDPLIKLLGSKYEPTILAILLHFHEIMKQFAADELSKQGMEPVYNAVMTLEKEYKSEGGGNWRLEHAIVKTFHEFPDFFDSDLIYEQATQVLLRKLIDV
jgi:hypothetical protein